MERRSAEQIISDLAKDDKVKQACRNIGGVEWNDYYQELFLIICEMPKDKIELIEEKKYLQFWIVRTLLNIRSDNNRFNSKNPILEDAEKVSEEREDEDEQVFIRQREIVGDILREIEQGGREKAAWYKVNLFKLYSEKQNISEIHRLTGIPFETIRRDVNNFRRELSAIINKRT